MISVKPRSSAKRSVLRRALPRTKNGIFFSSFSAAVCQLSRRSDAWRGCGFAQMRCAGVVVKFAVVAEHAQQMFLQAHHQRMHPGVEDNVGAFKPHLRGVACRKVLHMHRC